VSAFVSTAVGAGRRAAGPVRKDVETDVNATECTREQDVIDAVKSGRWPDRCGGGLRVHVAACAICADVLDVARAFQDEHDRAWRDARVPPSGRVWWRAEMRARQEAARKAAQPITVVQGVAGACAAGIAIAVFGVLSPRVWQSLGLQAAVGYVTDVTSVKSVLGAGWLQLASLSAAVPPQIVLSLGIALGAGLVLTPLALYFVFSEK